MQLEYDHLPSPFVYILNEGSSTRSASELDSNSGLSLILYSNFWCAVQHGIAGICTGFIGGA